MRPASSDQGSAGGPRGAAEGWVKACSAGSPGNGGRQQRDDALVKHHVRTGDSRRGVAEAETERAMRKELLAGIRFAGADCAACADLSVVQIVICKSTGAAFANSGHNALNAMPKMASQATKRRFMRRSL